MKLIPTVLCGGAGSRLWPVSREMHPKPFIRLEDGQSLLQKAFLRGARLPEVAEVLVVTNRDLAFKVKDEFDEINADKTAISYIFEPCGRNTAAAIALAALDIEKRHGQDALMLVLAADHLINDLDFFANAVSRAVGFAREGRLVTFGIQPDAPETGYGYIEIDDNNVIQFVEKPDLETAKSYLASGRYLWNSGMFCFSVKTILQELHEHCPDILHLSRECLSVSRVLEGGGVSEIDLDRQGLMAVPDNSIDYAVMEKSRNVVVVPCDMGWNDIGSWNAIGDLVAPDANGNRVQGKALLSDVSNCYIQSHDRIVGAVGLDNLVIVDTPDALLVADKGQVQNVKKIYSSLKEQGSDAYKLHNTVHRPWGTYTVLEDASAYKIKRIEVKPGASLSLQMHHHRSEHWIVVSGTAIVVNGDQEIMVHTNQSTYIPAGHKHRLVNPGVLDLVLIEVQSGQYLGEDDIVRFEDKYGRA